MTKAITTKLPKYLSSFDEFEKKLLNIDDTKLLEKLADTYSDVPAFLRSLQNLEPTGIAGAIDQFLSEYKSQKEQKNTLLAIFTLTKVVHQYGYRIEQLEQKYLAIEFPKLTNLFFEYSRQTVDTFKIDLFKNIWINGLLAFEKTTSEKTIVFDIVRSLTEDEIKVLRFINDTSRKPSDHDPKYDHIKVNDLAKALGLAPAYAQQLCVRLRTHGLIGESSTGMSIGSNPPTTFMLMDFTDVLIKYILEPSQE